MELFPTLPLDSLTYIENFITTKQELELASRLDELEWDTGLKRRVLQFGWKYDYYTGSALGKANPVPDWIPDCGFPYDQVIVNEYLPGQGIGFHRDHVTSYGDTIGSLSLLSDCAMEFQLSDEIRSMRLDRCSLLIMQGDARWSWKHSIPARKHDRQYGITRSRRISITYRALA